MPPKRAAVASQAVALSQDSSYKDVLTFLSSILTIEQFTEASDLWDERNEQPDGKVLLSCQKTDLRKLGLSNTIATKVDQHLKEARLALATSNEKSDEENAAPISGQAGTPLVGPEGPPQRVDLNTAGPTVPKPRGRGRPPKNPRQSRLSQRLVAPAPETDEEIEEVAPPKEASDSDDDVVEIEEEEPESEEDQEPVVGRRNTRQRVTRLAAVERAQAHLQQMDTEFSLEDNIEEFVPSDSDDEMEEVAPVRPRGRGRPRARVQHLTALSEDDEEDDVRPEEPDDGVHPQNKHLWEDSVREGLPEILKQLTQQQLIDLIEDREDVNWDRKMYRYNARTRDGTSQMKNRGRVAIAKNITKVLLDGSMNPRRRGQEEFGGTTWDAVDELLTKYVDEQYIKSYLDNTLKLRFATPPKISDTRRMLWRLWSVPIPTAGPDSVSLGQITFPLMHVGKILREYWLDVVEYWAEDGVEAWMKTAKMNAAFKKNKELALEREVNEERVAAAAAAAAADPAVVGESSMGIKADPEGVKKEDPGRLELSEEVDASNQAEVVFEKPDEDGHDWPDLFEQLLNFQRQRGVNIRWRLDLAGMKLRGEVVVDFPTYNEVQRGDALVQSAYTIRGADGQQELVQIWLDKILQAMDHLQGSNILDEDLEALNVAWDAAIDDIEPRGVPLNVDPPLAVDIKMLDKIMLGVENLERPMEDGVEQNCAAKLALNLKPYQKRALSFLLREEKAPGGTARHLWLKVPLPGSQPGVECYVSPSLFQLYVSKSPTATGIALGNTGGGGWQALEMGMGKTAVMIAGILFNPPPVNWRRARPWTPYNPDDYLLTKTENMPRGGTLVVVPTTLIRQWELEIRKTLDNEHELSVLRWTDTHRITDCKEIGLADVVITTPQMVAKDSTLSSIYWHRVVVDEAQTNAGSMMQSGILISTHRWIVSGTPVNSHPESLRPSLEFLRLGGYNDAQRHLPPALSTVMRAVMLRYTKDGVIDGEKNLDLPPLTEKVMVCPMDDKDTADEAYHKVETYLAFRKKIMAGMHKAGFTQPVDEVLANPTSLNAMVKNGQVKLPPLKKMMSDMRGIVGGGKHINIPGEMVYNARLGREVFDTRYFQSKAQGVVACLAQLRVSEPTAKVLVFSQYEETLKSIATLLPDHNLDHRCIYGGTSAKKRGEAIEAFMNDPPTRIFLLTAQAGAVGITLTAATHVYICEPLLNPALELQAIGRSRRMGQTKPVTVVRLYHKGTIEEKVRQLIARKHGGPKMQSTAMAANAGAVELQCNLGDMNELLKCDLGEDSDSDEEMAVL